MTEVDQCTPQLPEPDPLFIRTKPDLHFGNDDLKQKWDEVWAMPWFKALIHREASLITAVHEATRKAYNAESESDRFYYRQESWVWRASLTPVQEMVWHTLSPYALRSIPGPMIVPATTSEPLGPC